MEKGVEYCMPLYVDVHGIAKTKTVPVSHFDRMMRGSELVYRRRARRPRPRTS